MSTFRTVWFATLLLCLPWAAQAVPPTILAPANGATGLSTSGFQIDARSLSTGNTADDPDPLFIEVSDDPNFGIGGFYTSSSYYYKENDASFLFQYFVPGPLPQSTVLFIRAVSDLHGPGPTIQVTTRSNAITIQGRAAFINGGQTAATGANPIPATAYANARRCTLQLNAPITNADSVEWQFDPTNTTFTTVARTYRSEGVQLIFNADDPGLVSGQAYFVRVRGYNSTNVGPWSTAANIRRFVNALHPCVLTAPTGTVNRTAFKIWTTQVDNATAYYFQVDDDPTFSSPLVLTGPHVGRNLTVNGIDGNVFQANYTAPGAPGQIAFDYIYGLFNNTPYYVRVRAVNANQSGYWHTVNTVTPTAIPVTGFFQPLDGATNVTTDVNIIFRDVPSFNVTSYEFQLSKDNFATLEVSETGLTNRVRHFANLDFDRTYWARVRAFVQGQVQPTAWATITFTTKTVPTLQIAFPTPAFEFANTGVHAYASYEGNVGNYDWQVERLDQPGSLQVSGPARGRHFATFLVRGGSYRMRVRGTAANDPTLIGPWSSWVLFTVMQPQAPAGPALSGIEDKPTPPVTPGDVERPATLAATDEPRDETTPDRPADGSAQRMGGGAAKPLKVWPNPATGPAQIIAPAAGRLRIVDLTGQEWLSQSVAAGERRTLGPELPSGVYLITLIHADGQTPTSIRWVKR